MKQECHLHPVRSKHTIYTWKCSSTLNSASSKQIYGTSVARNSLAEMKKKKKGETSKRPSSCFLHNGACPLPKEIQPKQISGLRKKRTGYTLQYKLIFMCFCQEGHKPERFQTVTQDRGVLKVNLSPSILRGSIVLSCCCDFMDFWNTSPQPLFLGVIN